jgi:hypothetical protein
MIWIRKCTHRWPILRKDRLAHFAKCECGYIIMSGTGQQGKHYFFEQRSRAPVCQITAKSAPTALRVYLGLNGHRCGNSER